MGNDKSSASIRKGAGPRTSPKNKPHALIIRLYTKSVKANLLFAVLLAYSSDGKATLSNTEITAICGLSRKEQITARRILKQEGLIAEALTKGIPPKICFQLFPKGTINCSQKGQSIVPKGDKQYKDNISSKESILSLSIKNTSTKVDVLGSPNGDPTHTSSEEPLVKASKPSPLLFLKPSPLPSFRRSKMRLINLTRHDPTIMSRKLIEIYREEMLKAGHRTPIYGPKYLAMVKRMAQSFANQKEAESFIEFCVRNWKQLASKISWIPPNPKINVICSAAFLEDAIPMFTKSATVRVKEILI